MLQNLHKNSRKGFTLVEIMIVVAIIALLAAIALPSLQRARMRSQATRVLEDLRLVESAQAQWALENNKKSSDAVTWTDLQPYFKAGSALATGSLDSLGNPITIGTVGGVPQISGSTAAELESVTNSGTFWGSYYTTGSGG